MVMILLGNQRSLHSSSSFILDQKRLSRKMISSSLNSALSWKLREATTAASHSIGVGHKPFALACINEANG